MIFSTIIILQRLTILIFLIHVFFLTPPIYAQSISQLDALVKQLDALEKEMEITANSGEVDCEKPRKDRELKWHNSCLKKAINKAKENAIKNAIDDFLETLSEDSLKNLELTKENLHPYIKGEIGEVIGDYDLNIKTTYEYIVNVKVRIQLPDNPNEILKKILKKRSKKTLISKTDPVKTLLSQLAPSEAPKPTPSPSEAPKPTPSPSEAPKPDPSPSEAPKPTPIPSEVPEPTPSPSEVPEPTPSPSEVPKPKPDLYVKKNAVHVVKAGDNLKKIASTYCQDASKWELIYKTNKNLIKDEKNLMPGWKLEIPYVGDGLHKVHLVKGGDTLEKLAKKYYGDSTMSKYIRGKNAARIKDKNILRTGWKLIIPISYTDKYIVKKGDSLTLIAKKLYGDANEHDDIYSANEYLIKSRNLLLTHGRELAIPCSKNNIKNNE
ncbi:LysM peptidoglycan-binding domain-containing protein [Desulfococcaceae bacterium HSG9]|nr:LysM peptidoglycan-binding domain-containing protein [Desulfococcaceae bacterium HSG9]